MATDRSQRSKRLLDWLIHLPDRFARITNGKDYIRQIDGLRFLAIIPVLFYHSGLRGERLYGPLNSAEQSLSYWLPKGGVGVSLFFFISGYIIAYPFLSGRTPSLKKFYVRRLTRLEPPYLLVMLGCFMVLALGFVPADAPNFHATQAPLWQSFLASVFYMHSFVFGEHPRLNPPTWSLEREIQFYLIAPFILWAYLRCANRNIRLVIGGALTIALTILGQLIIHGLDEGNPWRHSLFVEAQGFILGVVLCDYSVKALPFEQPKTRAWDLGFGLGLAGLLASGCIDYYDKTLLGDIANALLRVSSVGLLFFGAAYGRLAYAFMGQRWIALIGGACYSIYLVHVPLMQGVSAVMRRVFVFDSLGQAWAVSFAIMIPAALAVGLAFYVLIERPCMDPRWPQKLWNGIRGRSAPEPRA